MAPYNYHNRFTSTYKATMKPKRSRSYPRTLPLRQGALLRSGWSRSIFSRPAACCEKGHRCEDPRTRLCPSHCLILFFLVFSHGWGHSLTPFFYHPCYRPRGLPGTNLLSMFVDFTLQLRIFNAISKSRLEMYPFTPQRTDRMDRPTDWSGWQVVDCGWSTGVESHAPFCCGCSMLLLLLLHLIRFCRIFSTEQLCRDRIRCKRLCYRSQGIDPVRLSVQRSFFLL